MIPLSLGIVVSVMLWVAVGFQVGLQESKLQLASNESYIFIHVDTCDMAWQQTRDDLILSSFNFSIVSVLLIVVVSVTIMSKQSHMHSCMHSILSGVYTYTRLD
jgi:hypothetical protein